MKSTNLNRLAMLTLGGLVTIVTSVHAQDTQAPANTTPDFSLIGYATLEGGTKGGEGGEEVTVSTASDFIAAADSSAPTTVLVSGTIDLGSDTVKVASRKTIVGVGDDAGFVGHVYFHGVSNVIMRNLSLANPQGVGQGIGGGDCMTTHSSNHVWVDHCNFGDCSDGQLDITHGSDLFTVSWCKFSYTDEANRHRLSMLIGNRDDLGPEDAGKLQVTLHHNWIGDFVYDRVPRVRFGQIHIFNTYFGAKGNNVCIGLGCSSQVLLENSYFEGIKRPWKPRSNPRCPLGQIQWNNDNVFVDSKIPTWTANSPVFTPQYSYALDAGKYVKDTVVKYAGVGKGPFAP